MDFELPREITAKLAELDAFIEAEIKPLERDTCSSSIIAARMREPTGTMTGVRAPNGAR